MILSIVLAIFTYGSTERLPLSKDVLVNTRWECHLGKECVDYFVFRRNHRVDSYSCELEVLMHSSYQLVKDTLIVKSTRDFEEMKETWRYKFLIRGNELRPVNTEAYRSGKWQVVRSKFDPRYVFYKAGSAKK